MPATRYGNRRAATMRTVLGAVNENETYQECNSKSNVEENKVQTMENQKNGLKSSFQISEFTDGSNQEQVNLLLADLEKFVKTLQENIAIKACEATKEQHQEYFLGMNRLGKSIKNMKIRDFNSQYMDGGDIISVVKSKMNNFDINAKKRMHPGNPSGAIDGSGNMPLNLETPAKYNLSHKTGPTPKTITRTMKKGELTYSINGSPVDKSEEGDLVATVSKKRRGEIDSALFDINVGEGRYISLSDPSTIEHLDGDMKNTAISQLKVLQDQMACLMAKLGN